MKFNILNILTLSVVFLYATAFAGDADRVKEPKKRAAFNAAAFLAPALAPVPMKVEAEKPAPTKRAAFNAAAFLAPVPVPVKVEAEKPAPRKRAAFNTSAFLPAPVVGMLKLNFAAAGGHAAAGPDGDGVDLAKINHLLAELRRFDDISHSGRYAEVSKTILLMKALYENKDKIIDFANLNWENVRLMRDIDSVALPLLKINKYATQCEYFRAVIEDYVVKVQYNLRDQVDRGISYAPVFETVEYVFGGPMVNLPVDQAGRELIFTTVTTHLIDGARMLTKAANWLEGNLAYYRTFFTGNWGDNSGCIPKRNGMLKSSFWKGYL